MIVPFYRPSLTRSEIDEVLDCLKSGWLTTGPRAKQFEQEFARYLGKKHAVALNSCTAALHLALEATGLQAGDMAVVPTMTFAATAEVVRYFNATPLLVDCRESDFNLNVADAERRVEQALARGEKVVAILPVHYGGQIGDVAGVQALARRFNLKVIEDAAHCCPSYYREDGRQRTEGGGRQSGNGKPVSVLSRQSSVLSRPSSVLSPQSSVLSRLSSVLSRLSSVLSRLSSVLSRQSSVLSRLSSVLSHQSSVFRQQSSVFGPLAASRQQRGHHLLFVLRQQVHHDG